MQGTKESKEEDNNPQRTREDIIFQRLWKSLNKYHWEINKEGDKGDILASIILSEQGEWITAVGYICTSKQKMTKYQVALALGHKIYGREVPVQDVIKEFKMRIENYCLLFTRVLS